MNSLTPPALAALLLLTAPALAQAEPRPAPAAEPTGPFGVLVCEANGVRYPLTPTDALWAARMLTGEAGGRDDADSAGVLWCMLNSYSIRNVRKRYPTLSAFVRAYCTPLQPWLKAKGVVNRHRRRGTPMEEVEPGRFQLVRHLTLQRKSWTQLSAGVRSLVLRVFRGQLPSVCRNATQFCSTAVYYRDKHSRRPNRAEHEVFTEAYAARKKYRWVVPEGSNVLKNVFFEELRFDHLPKPAVKILPPTRRRRRR